MTNNLKMKLQIWKKQEFNYLLNKKTPNLQKGFGAFISGSFKVIATVKQKLLELTIL